MFDFCSTVTKLPFINKLRRRLIDLASRFRGFSLCGMECMAKQTRLCHGETQCMGRRNFHTQMAFYFSPFYSVSALKGWCYSNSKYVFTFPLVNPLQKLCTHFHKCTSVMSKGFINPNNVITKTDHLLIFYLGIYLTLTNFSSTSGQHSH